VTEDAKPKRATGRGSKPASKANLTGKPSLAERNKGVVKGAAKDPKVIGARGGAAKAANAKHNEEVGDAFARGDVLAAFEQLIADGGANLAYILRKERTQHEKPEQAVTTRIEALRKLINDATAYRDRMTTETPADEIAAAIVERMRVANFSEESAAHPPPDLPDPEPDDEDDGD